MSDTKSRLLLDFSRGAQRGSTIRRLYEPEARLCAAVCSFGSAGKGGEKVDQSPHGRDGHGPLFRCKV